MSDQKRAEKQNQADRRRGFGDGMAGRDPAEDGPAYKLGHYEGRQAREQAHLRLEARCRRDRERVAAEGGRLV